MYVGKLLIAQLNCPSNVEPLLYIFDLIISVRTGNTDWSVLISESNVLFRHDKLNSLFGTQNK